MSRHRLLKTSIAVVALIFCSFAGRAAPPSRPLLQVTAYTINADIDPAVARLTATVQVTFTALEDVSTATFELNNGLRVTKITDATGATLQSDRNPTTSTINVAMTAPIAKGTSTTLSFEYTGTLNGADTSPVEGIKLAAIADPITMLLYPGRWFPVSGLYTQRFTAEMHIRVPKGETVIASGATNHPAAPASTVPTLHATAHMTPRRAGGGVGTRTTAKPTTTAKADTPPAAPAAAPTSSANMEEFDFSWQKPGFPGTVIAGKFLPAIRSSGARNVSIYVTEKHKTGAAEYAAIAARQQEFFTTTFGEPQSSTLNIVEMPEDAVAASWAPEIAAIAGNRIGNANSSRLLSNTIAHQWWGSEVSPYTLNDAWITNGMSRYAELMFLEDASGKTAFQNAVTDVSAGALAYDTAPLATLGRVDPYSPQFQSETLEKGAMVFHMLRYQMGDEKFPVFLRGLLSQFAGKGVRSSDVETVAAAQSGLNLTPFFAQWIDGTGAPAFTSKFTVYRLGGNKGFRTIGAISQDLDLFRMPVDLRIETEGKTENKRIDVSGTDSHYTIETFGRPRRIVIDPEHWVLKSTPDLAVRVAVLKGQQLVAQGDLIGALAEYQHALDANKNSSLATYRIAEVFFTQRNYQSAANSYRDSLRGDNDPKWTEVWSHIGLGRVFDLTGQRDRAVNEYRLAVQTNDNTQGAINEARALLQKPYTRERSPD
ncbi:M1 family aminopeptidase [Terriglobus saanensis]|uniref:Peptidase M1 membrane alanine aminopeptidase n=1 Tax=Terriglobus saanensis (strain ATCC BAA-1853 / DSM 23119 / SP1PR4) TaxID=401053 RepID=E8UX48_TERSS|nr:Peptidase M1 membrane alanine aminopeptidase [Terriglobus saanensis SP1PR4]